MLNELLTRPDLRQVSRLEMKMVGSRSQVRAEAMINSTEEGMTD